MSSGECRDLVRWLGKQGWDVWQDKGYYHGEHKDTDLTLRFGSNVNVGTTRSIRTDALRALGAEDTRPRKPNPKNVQKRRDLAVAKTAESARSLSRERADLRLVKKQSVDEYEAQAAKITKTHDAKVGAFSLSTHALAQMLRLNISAADAAEALTEPRNINVSGDQPTYVGRRCFVVANPDRRKIITVGR